MAEARAAIADGNARQLADETKALLQERSEDFVFVEDSRYVDAFRCNRCRRVAVRHRIAHCEHLFCEDCFESLPSDLCPVCAVPIVRRNGVDNELERRLLQLKMACPYQRNGCEETTSLGSVLDHEKRCKFSTNALLPKVYKEGHAAAVLEQLTDDLFVMKNEIRKFEKKLKEVVFVEKQFNSLFETICTDIKAINTEMEKMTEKFNREASVRLEFEKSLVTRNEQNNEILQKMMTKTIEELKRHIDTQLGRFRDEEFPQRHLANGRFGDARENGGQFEDLDAHPIVFNWTIAGIKQKLRDFQDLNLESTKSKTFFIEETALKVRAVLRVDDRSGYLAISLEFLNGGGERYHPPMYPHSRKYVLVDQKDNKRNIVVVDQPRLRKNQIHFMTKERLSFSDNLAPIKLLEKDDAYIENDSIAIHVAIQPISLMYKSVASDNGILLWKIEKYSERKRDEADGVIRCLYSDSFYTHQRGYRVQGRIFLNGNGDEDKVKCISIYAGFLIGEHDEALPNTFDFIATFYLLDQSDSPQKQHLSKQCERTYNEDYMFYGLYDFVLQSQAENPTYLKNDTLLIRMAVRIV